MLACQEIIAQNDVFILDTPIFGLPRDVAFSDLSYCGAEIWVLAANTVAMMGNDLGKLQRLLTLSNNI